MTTATQFFSGGIKSIQTGYVSTTGTTSGAGEDASYTDVTISSVDASKCVVYFSGGAGTSATIAIVKAGSTTSYIVTPRVTSSTNLRLATSQSSQTHIVGRWTVVEYN